MGSSAKSVTLQQHLEVRLVCVYFFLDFKRDSQSGIGMFLIFCLKLLIYAKCVAYLKLFADFVIFLACNPGTGRRVNGAKLYRLIRQRIVQNIRKLMSP